MVAAATLAACGAGDTRVDPGDLELRDLLGIAPDAALHWDADQRASARRVLEGGLDEHGDPVELDADAGSAIDERIARALAQHDAGRADAGDDALGLVRIDPARSRRVMVIPRRAITASAVAHGGPAPAVELQLSDRWQPELAGRGGALLAAIASDAGHASGPVVVVLAPRLAVIASYTGGAPARLLVNPVLLTALDPAAANEVPDPAPGDDGAPRPAIARDTNPTGPAAAPPTTQNAGNPYSFYGSIEECAFAQRTRCESCLGAGDCEAITRGNDGNAECAQLGDNNGRGYFLICANLALAIASVQRCAADTAPSCARDIDAASDLAQLEANADFIDDPACGTALDGCLAKIYGAPIRSRRSPGHRCRSATRSATSDCGSTSTATATPTRRTARCWSRRASRTAPASWPSAAVPGSASRS